MSLLPTTEEIRSALRSKQFDSVKNKCDLALNYSEGVESLPWLLARAEALCSLGELDEAMADVQNAISIAPDHPECNLCLGQVLQAMASKAFSDGKQKCTGNQHSFTLNRLNSLEAASEKVLALAKVKGRGDPASLPKEVFSQIMNLQDPETKLKCLSLCKGWKMELEAELLLWREITAQTSNRSHSSRSRSKSPKIKVPSIIKLFALKSKGTLRSVDLHFALWDAATHKLHQCFEHIGNSSDTLKTLNFTGYLQNANVTYDAVTLAAKCTSLETFQCTVGESFYQPDSPPEDGSNWEWDTSGGEQYYEQVYFDRFKFNSFPSTIILASSGLSDLDLGVTMEFFQNARHVEIDLSEGSSPDDLSRSIAPTQASILKLLEVSSKTLKSLEFNGSHPLDRKRDQSSNVALIQLPKLQRLKIKIDGTISSGHFQQPKKVEDASSISIMAPNIKPEDFSVADGSFVLKESV